MKRFYAVIYLEEGELVYAATDYEAIVKFFGDKNLYFYWQFTYKDNEISVYTAALSAMPLGEQREEMEERVLLALNLI